MKSEKTVTFNRQEFVLFWMASAHMAGIPAHISAMQLNAFEAPLGMNFTDEVSTVTHEDFGRASVDIKQALEKRYSNGR